MCGAGGEVEKESYKMDESRESLNGREPRVESEGGGDGQLAVGAELGRGLHSLAFLVFSCLFLVFSWSFLGLFFSFSFLLKYRKVYEKPEKRPRKEKRRSSLCSYFIFDF